MNPLSSADRRLETPLRLGAAAQQFGLTAGALRAEAKRGRLVIWRVAGKDWTSLAEIERMFQRCRVLPEVPGFGSDPLDHERGTAPSNSPSGSSETEAVASALAAARTIAQRLKNNSPPTSPPNISPPAGSATLVRFPSQT
jgi:hypothetical protein